MIAQSNVTSLLTSSVECVAMRVTWLETVQTDSAELTGAMALQEHLHLAVLLLGALAEVMLSTVNMR